MNSFSKALNDTKTAAKIPNKTSTVACIEDVPSEVKEAVDKYNEAKEKEKNAKRNMTEFGTTIIDFTREVQDRLAFKGSFSKSFDVSGEKTSAKIVAANKFSIKSDDKKLIEKMLGKKFNTMIEETFSLKVKNEVLEDEKLQKEFMDLIGDRFADFFESTSTLKVVKDFDEKIYSTVKNQKKLDELREVVKQVKPSIK